MGSGPRTQRSIWYVPWHLLEPREREVLRSDLDCDNLEWQRGRAWALEQVMGAVWYYAESNFAMSAMAQRTLKPIMD